MKLFYKVNALFCVILSLLILIPMFLLDIPYIMLRWLRLKLTGLGADNFIKAYGLEEVNRWKAEMEKDKTTL